jgi:hypothetical protein
VPTAYINYLAHASVGDLRASIAASERIGRDINALNAAGRPLTWAPTILTSPEEASEQLFPYNKVETLIGRTVPFLWVHLQYDPDRVAAEELARLAEEHGLVPFSEGRMEVSLFGPDGKHLFQNEPKR